MIVYRQMTLQDIPSGLSLCRSAGWNQTGFEWKLFLELSPDGCRVATDENGNIVGTVTTVRYQNHFSWIGMVLVDPTLRRQGMGLQLLRESLQILHDDKTIKLDATPEGREVYLKLSFIDEYSLNRLLWNKVSANKLPVSLADTLHPDDLPELLEFDREVFGADRQQLLKGILKEAPHLAFMIKENNKISGYCFARIGHNFTQIGPVVAHDLDDAIHLFSAALHQCNGGPVILDVMENATEWIDWLSTLGFVKQRLLIRMVRGSNEYPGVPEKQFAILGPEFG